MSTHAMWYHFDGTFIINRTIILDDYIIRFVLNRPYVPFKALLTSINANILSPSSTPEDRFIYPSENLVGTGPYILENNVENESTTIILNENYWGLPKPSIKKFIFIPYDFAESSERLLAKETDYAAGNDSYFLEYNSDPTIVVDDFISPRIDYLGMNNIQINVTMRKAISYALNYSLILETKDKYCHGSVIRCRSTIPYGTLYSNWQDFNIPVYDVQVARQTLVDANWTGTSGLPVDENVSSGNLWEAIGSSPTPLATYNITYINGTSPYCLFLKEFSEIITSFLKQIGVHVIIYPMSYWEHWSNIIYNKNTTLFLIGAETLYNDPAHFFDALFSNKTGFAYNLQQTDDLIVQSWMEDAIVETNPLVRNQTYYNIQKRIIEELYPIAYVYSFVWYDVYRINLKGWGNWGAGSLRHLFFA